MTNAQANTTTARASRLRVCVIGTGKVSDEHLRFVSASPRTTLEAVCDLSPSLASYARDMWKARASYTDYREMLGAVKPDVVHVVTPPHTHAMLVRDCLMAGAHVLCEKPITPTLAEYETLHALAAERGVRLMENHNYRFNGPTLELERLVGAGEIGDVTEVEVRMVLPIRGGGRYADVNLPHPSHRMPAGVLHEFISHLGYLALRFAPGPVDCWARWANLGGGTLFRFDDLDSGYRTASGACARIRFACNQAPDCFTLTLRGTKGMAHADLFQPHVLVNKQRKGGAQLSPLVNQWVAGKVLRRASVQNFRNKVMQRTPYEGLGTMLGLVYDALATGGPAPVSSEDTRAVLGLIDRLVALQGAAPSATRAGGAA